jgi:hypothetical protein
MGTLMDLVLDINTLGAVGAVESAVVTWKART